MFPAMRTAVGMPDEGGVKRRSACFNRGRGQKEGRDVEGGGRSPQRPPVHSNRRLVADGPGLQGGARNRNAVNQHLLRRLKLANYSAAIAQPILGRDLQVAPALERFAPADSTYEWREIGVQGNSAVARRKEGEHHCH